MKILVVDDEKVILTVMCRYLEKQGHTVEAAEDGEKGWETFNRSPGEFDVIITDLNMPVMDGLQMLKLIRETGYDIPAVAVTGYVEMIDNQLISELKIVELFTKPFLLTDLEPVLEKLKPKP
ncbi:MAG: response regulator [bacterium]|nr:response regulator [bacterium]